MVDVNGKSYRVFRLESIHEDDTFVECRDVDSNDLLCEVRIDAQRRAYVMPFTNQIDLDLFPVLVEYVRAL